MYTWTIFNLIAGVALIVGGLFFRFRTPRFNSKYSGIVVPFARKNEEVWSEAHRYAALPVIAVGIFAVMISLLPFLFVSSPNQTPASGLIIGGIAVALALTKKHIDTHFDENGNRLS